MRYLLVGNYGVGNVGDEALKEYFLKEFDDIDWRVVSASPNKGEYPRLPGGFRSFFLTPWPKTLWILLRSDGVVFGGGSLFTDTESVYACYLWCWYAFVVRLLGKDVYFAFQGVGPFRTRLGAWIARCALGTARFISVRDEQSFKRVEQWKLNKNLVQSFDPVLKLISSQKLDERSKNVLVIIPRMNSSMMFRLRSQELSLSTNWEEIKILSLQPDSKDEQKMCSQIQAALSDRSDIIPVYSMDELVEHVQLSSFVLSQRYHGSLAALALGIENEIVVQKEGDKLSSLKDFDLDELSERIEDGEEELRDALYED